MKCPTCNSELEFKLTPNNVHYGREDCLICKKFIRWIKNPNSPRNIKVRKYTSKLDIKDILEFHNKKNELCFFCLRDRNQLGQHETMTIDHIEELDKGGTDEIGNLQILCSACMKLKNWARLYMNWHLQKEGNNETNN